MGANVGVGKRSSSIHQDGKIKGLAKLGNIAAETLLLVMFPWVAKRGNICCGRKICFRKTKTFLTSGKNIFCFRAAKFESATYASRAAKLGNICLRNDNVSATMFPSLARPLKSYKRCRFDLHETIRILHLSLACRMRPTCIT